MKTMHQLIETSYNARRLDEIKRNEVIRCKRISHVIIATLLVLECAVVMAVVFLPR